MIEKNVVLLEEELKEVYRPKMETWMRLTEKYRTEEAIKTLMDSLEKKSLQTVGGNDVVFKQYR